MNDAHVRKLQTALSCKSKIDKLNVEYHQNMQDQEKHAAAVLAKDKFTTEKKLKKHAATSGEISGKVSQNIYELKHEASFQKEERDSERLSWEEAISQERDIGKKTLLLDYKFQSNQLTKLKQSQYYAQSTDSSIN